MSQEVLAWIIFNIFIIITLAFDLGVFQKQHKEMKIREALIWSVIWILVALLFNVGIYFVRGKEVALNFFTGYLLERSLSVDNIFVFIIIFSHLKVPSLYQHKVLALGIFGALIMRAVFIVAGVALIQQFEWVIYILGAFLVFTGIKMALNVEEDIDIEKNVLLAAMRRWFPVTANYHEDKYFVKREGKMFLTPLFIVVVLITVTDIVFAMDSIPAIFAVTKDAFIVYSSNAMAVMGLRAMYFAVNNLVELFHYLKYGLAIILIVLGIKMLTEHFIHIPVFFTLFFIAFVLGVSIFLSVSMQKNKVKKS